MKKRYRFKTLKELEATCIKLGAGYVCGVASFVSPMNYLCGKEVERNDRMYTKVDGWMITPEMLVEIPMEEKLETKPTLVQQIVYNGVTCSKCNEHLVSYHRHDYKTCGCDNETFVDGGVSYLNYGGKDMSFVRPVTVYADDNFEAVRKVATRGSRGKDGTQPLKWVPICEMSDEYIGAVLQYGAAGWHLELLSKELQYRREHEITISENETVACADSAGNDGHSS